MVYKAEVTTNTTYKEYYGMSLGEFKSRYNNHLQYQWYRTIQIALNIESKWDWLK